MTTLWKRRLAIVLAVLCLVTTPVSADGGGQVLYDESNGENLGDLLRDNDEVWPTMAVSADSADLEVKAKGAVLMDQGTGTVLYEKDARTHLPIASVTKVMTLLLTVEALEAGKIALTDPVTCSDTAAALGGSQIWLEPGEIMTVEELVKAAAVVSANDACGVLAEHLAGSQTAFVAQMNARAAQLGMQDTQFADCSGLDDTGYSCAYDVALMSRELMTHPLIEQYTTIWMDSLRGGASQLVNTNKLLRHYKGATGLKTGTTNAAGHCLSATARRENTSFIAVVLGCSTTADRWAGARTLLDYGFAGYVNHTPSADTVNPEPVKVLGGQQKTVTAVPDTPGALLLRKGTEEQLESTVEMLPEVEAPVSAGQTVGVWRLKIGEETVGEYPIRAAGDVPATTLRWAYGLLMDTLLG